MIRITAVYANTAGSRFDIEDYVGRHTPFARDLLRPHGLVELRTSAGLAGLDGSPPAFWVVSEMVFSSRAAFDTGMAAVGGALFADIPNYTDTTPTLQLSELRGG